MEGDRWHDGGQFIPPQCRHAAHPPPSMMAKAVQCDAVRRGRTRRGLEKRDCDRFPARVWEEPLGCSAIPGGRAGWHWRAICNASLLAVAPSFARSLASLFVPLIHQKTDAGGRQNRNILESSEQCRFSPIPSRLLSVSHSL